MATLASRADCAHLTRGPATPMPRLWAVLVLTGTFMVLAAWNRCPASTSSLTLLTAWIAQRPANETKTYGYLRWEILAALVNGAALFGIAGWVVLEAIRRIHHPEPIRTGLFLAVAAAGLLVNLFSLALLHKSREGSLNARGAYLHVMGDALGSIGALTAAAIIWLTGWTLADPIVSIALSLLILAGAWQLLRESTDILLDAVPRHVALGDVHRRILGVPGGSLVVRPRPPQHHQRSVQLELRMGDPSVRLGVPVAVLPEAERLAQP